MKQRLLFIAIAITALLLVFKDTPHYHALFNKKKAAEKERQALAFDDHYPEAQCRVALPLSYESDEEAARKENMNNLYNQAFNSYKKRDFASAVQYSSQVMSMNPDTSLAAKTQFINTVSKSRNLGNNEFASALKSYISSDETVERRLQD